MEQPAIRRARSADAPGILVLLNQTAAETPFPPVAQNNPARVLKEQRAQISGAGAHTNSLVLVAESGGEIVGTLHFTGKSGDRTRHSGEFGIVVRRDFRRRGVGRRLIDELTGWAKLAGISKINLRVRDDNQGAINLYLAAGFAMEGRISREYRVEDRYYDACLMGLQID